VGYCVLRRSQDGVEPPVNPSGRWDRGIATFANANQIKLGGGVNLEAGSAGQTANWHGSSAPWREQYSKLVGNLA
jgi:hypothetical protein